MQELQGKNIILNIKRQTSCKTMDFEYHSSQRTQVSNAYNSGWKIIDLGFFIDNERMKGDQKSKEDTDLIFMSQDKAQQIKTTKTAKPVNPSLMHLD